MGSIVTTSIQHNSSSLSSHSGPFHSSRPPYVVRMMELSDEL